MTMTRSIQSRLLLACRTGAIAGMAMGFVVPDGTAAAEFATASVRFEQNATDGDVEVVFDVKGGKDGLAELTIAAPNGRKVVVFNAPDSATLGMRQFRFESPEPADTVALKAAYPEGVYAFSGRTFSGATLAGKATLSHYLPPVATIISPAADAKDVAADKVSVTWRVPAGLASCIVEIKEVTTGEKVTAQLPGSSSSFAPPAGFLAAGKKYKLAVGTVGRDGNISFVEGTFATAR